MNHLIDPNWLKPGAVVPVDKQTTAALVNALRSVLMQPESQFQRRQLAVDKNGMHWISDNECIHIDLIRKVEAVLARAGGAA